MCDRLLCSFWKKTAKWWRCTLAVAGAAVALFTLPTALIMPGGGYLTQLGVSAAMYGGFMAASVFDSQVQADMDAIG